MRHSLHRCKLVWTKNISIRIEIFVHRFTDATLPFPVGHACMKNSVSYENHENVMWQWLPSRLRLVIYKIVMWVQGVRATVATKANSVN